MLRGVPVCVSFSGGRRGVCVGGALDLPLISDKGQPNSYVITVRVCACVCMCVGVPCYLQFQSCLAFAG